MMPAREGERREEREGKREKGGERREEREGRREKGGVSNTENKYHSFVSLCSVLGLTTSCK